MPTTERSMREGLYKEARHWGTSGGPTTLCLLDWASLTSWKRFEMTQSMRFDGVTEATFQAMMRRRHESEVLARGGSI